MSFKSGRIKACTKASFNKGKTFRVPSPGPASDRLNHPWKALEMNQNEIFAIF